MTELSTFTIEELWNEIADRTIYSVLAYSLPPKTGSIQSGPGDCYVAFSGGEISALGLCRYTEMRLNSRINSAWKAIDTHRKNTNLDEESA